MKFFSPFLFLIFSLSLNAQMGHEKWQHRLILVMAKDRHNADFKKQLEILSQNPQAMTERKLKIYRILPDCYTTGIHGDDWKKSNRYYKAYHTENKHFEVVLIGLDGGVKLRKTKPITQEKLFSTIDAMPMRQAEMRREDD